MFPLLQLDVRFTNIYLYIYIYSFPPRPQSGCEVSLRSEMWPLAQNSKFTLLVFALLTFFFTPFYTSDQLFLSDTKKVRFYISILYCYRMNALSGVYNLNIKQLHPVRAVFIGQIWGGGKTDLGYRIQNLSHTFATNPPISNFPPLFPWGGGGSSS